MATGTTEDDALEALEELCAEAEFQGKSLNILEAIRRVSEEVIGYVEEHHPTKAQDPSIISIRKNKPPDTVTDNKAAVRSWIDDQLEPSRKFNIYPKDLMKFKHPIKSAANMKCKKSDNDLTSINVDTNLVIEAIGTSINKAVYLIRKADGSEGTIPTTFVTEVLEGANEPDDNYKQI